jgi:pyruvate/2-oxoglutarate dehydrogenase complex dihydrolipoamide acyltransferase (E2) component
MSIEILMPALSPTMTEGNLTKWLVTEGQEVKAGDVIAEIETDKATMEVEAVDEGFVEKLLFKEGDMNIPVNQPIALISDQQSSQSKNTKQKQESVEEKKTTQNKEVKLAADFALESNFPDNKELYTDVYL